MIDTLIALLIGIFVGTNFGFIIAGLMEVADDGEEMSD